MQILNRLQGDFKIGTGSTLYVIQLYVWQYRTQQREKIGAGQENHQGCVIPITDKCVTAFANEATADKSFFV